MTRKLHPHCCQHLHQHVREDLGCPTELKVVFANKYLHLCVCTRSFSAADEGESVADSDRSPATTSSGTWPGPGAADVWPHNQPSSFTEKLKRGSPRYIVLYVDSRHPQL